MADLDLDIIIGKTKTVRLLGKDIPFKRINMEEYLFSEHMIQELDNIQMTTKKSIAKGMKVVYEYLEMVLEITPEDAQKVTLEQFQALRKYMQRKDMYDQGYSDEDINEIERAIIKKQMEQTK